MGLRQQIYKKNLYIRKLYIEHAHMEKQKIHSFSSRMTRHIFLIVFVTMGVMSFMMTTIASKVIDAFAREHFADMLELTNEKVSEMLNVVEVSAINILDEVSYYIDDPDSVAHALEEEIILNNRIRGTALGFIPDYYPREGHWYEPYAYFNDDGTLETGQIGSKDHNYFEAEWYQKGLEAEEGGFWSDPYYDDAGSRTMLISYALPVRDKSGQKVGVLTADLDLNWLSEQVHALDSAENRRGIYHVDMDSELATYCFILSRSGKYIVHPDKSRILNRSFFEFAQDDDSGYMNLGNAMMEGEKGYQQVTIDGVDALVCYAPLRQTGWSMAIVVPRDRAAVYGKLVTLLISFQIFLGLIFIAIFCFRDIRKSTRSLRQLADATVGIANGNFDTPIPPIRRHDEIYLLRESFVEMTHSLQDYIDKLTESTARTAAMDSELHIARGIQMAMLPDDFQSVPEYANLDIYAELTPAKAVGGDLYDFYIRDGKLFFCIGDVSGKGVPASLVMAVTSTQFWTLSGSDERPDMIVRKINDADAQQNPSMMFVTLFIGVLDLNNGRLSYCNAGHNAPILIDADGKVHSLEVDANIAVGIIPDRDFSLQETQLEKGSTLFLYTDGLSEAEDVEHQLFGEERILDTLAHAETKDSEALIERMNNAVRNFVGDAEQSDDLTMLAIALK